MSPSSTDAKNARALQARSTRRGQAPATSLQCQPTEAKSSSEENSEIDLRGDAAVDGSHVRALKGGLTPDLRQSTAPARAASTT